MNQLVQIHGMRCRMTRRGESYQVHAPDGALLADATSRFLAVARAALAVLARRP